MKLRKLLLGAVVLAASTSIPSQAQIQDRVAFTIPPIAIVWSGGASGQARVSDFILGTGTAAANGDLIAAAGRAVVTGTLTQVATTGSSSDVGVTGAVDATAPGGFVDFDTVNAAFDIDGNTDVTVGPEIQSSFFVASNSAFNIQMDVAPTTTSTLPLTDVGYTLAVVSGSGAGDDDTGTAITGVPGNTGDNSRDPSAGTGTSSIATSTDLDAVDGTDVFVGNQSTAASVGSITSQSVRFDNTYTLDGFDLSDPTGSFEADVTFTVYIP